MSSAVGLTRRVTLLGGLGFAAGAGAAAMPRALGQPALKAARPTQAVLQAIAHAGKKRLVAAGERGIVIVSDDAGRSWTQAQVPVSVTLTALRFADERVGYAVGNMGVVLRTDDGGSSWAKVLDGAAAAQLALKAAPDSEDAQRLAEEGPDKPLLDLSVNPDRSVLVVGAYGLAFSSSDGGRSWASQMPRLPNPEGLSYYGIAARRGESFLFGEQGLLLRASGEAYAAQASPSTGSLFGALPLREGPLLLLGLRGKAWRSAEPGAEWAPVQTPVDASLLAGAQLHDGSVLLAGAAGQLLHSRDGGQRFAPVPLQQRFPFTGIAQAEGAVLLVGMRGLMRLDSLKS